MENNDNADDSHLIVVPSSQAEIDLDYKMALEKMVQNLFSDNSALAKILPLLRRRSKLKRRSPTLQLVLYLATCLKYSPILNVSYNGCAHILNTTHRTKINKSKTK